MSRPWWCLGCRPSSASILGGERYNLRPWPAAFRQTLLGGRAKMRDSVAGGDSAGRRFSPRAENFEAGGVGMDEDGASLRPGEFRLEHNKRSQMPTEALEGAEATRLRLEAELVARKLAEGEAIRRLPGASQDFA
jgi:hypothetical protein